MTLEHCFDVKHLGFTVYQPIGGYYDETVIVCNILGSQMDNGDLCDAAGDIWDDSVTF